MKKCRRRGDRGARVSVKKCKRFGTTFLKGGKKKIEMLLVKI